MVVLRSCEMQVSQALAILDNSHVTWERDEIEIVTWRRGKIESVFPINNGEIDQKFFTYVCKTKNWIY